MTIITKRHVFFPFSLALLSILLSMQTLAQSPESSASTLLESSTEPSQDIGKDSGANPAQNQLPKHDANAISARVDSLIDEPKNHNPQSEDRVDIIDYKHKKILGYMVLRNGNIIRRVLFKEPKDLHTPESHAPDLRPSAPLSQHPATTQSHNPPESAPNALESTPKSPSQNPPKSQTPTEAYLSTTPSDKERTKRQNTAPSSKTTEPKSHKHNTDFSPLSQEIGEESSRINKTYKNREWDKKKIPHDVQTRVIDIGH